jgi:nicotinamidase-related amidase
MRALVFVAILVVVVNANIWASRKNDPALKPIANDPGTGIGNWKSAIDKYGATKMWNAKLIKNTGQVPGGPKELMRFTSWWGLKTRPRRPILIIEDMNEGYRPYLAYLVPKVQQMIKAFRKAGLPILWSTWARRWDDHAWGSNDRFYGPENNKQGMNPEYVYKPNGIDIMKEVQPESPGEKKFVLESMHLSKFNDRYPDGSHILGPLLQQMGVDTVVMTGGWTEDCILGTISDAVDAWGLDAIAVSDAVGTATPEHKLAEDIYKTSYSAVYTADEITKFMDTKEGEKLFLKPMKDPVDTVIKPTEEPDFQKHYESAKKYFAKKPVVKDIKAPITLKPGEGGPSETEKPSKAKGKKAKGKKAKGKAEPAKVTEEKEYTPPLTKTIAEKSQEKLKEHMQQKKQEILISENAKLRAENAKLMAALREAKGEAELVQIGEDAEEDDVVPE